MARPKKSDVQRDAEKLGISTTGKTIAEMEDAIRDMKALVASVSIETPSDVKRLNNLTHTWWCPHCDHSMNMKVTECVCGAVLAKTDRTDENGPIYEAILHT